MRFPDWPERLTAYVEARRNLPHVWGENDCVQFAGGALEAMTGANPFAQWRGTYATQEEATAILLAEGGFVTALHRLLGKPVAPLQAMRGDLLFGELRPGQEGLAVCIGPAAVAPGWRHVIRSPKKDDNGQLTGQIATVPALAFLPRERFRIAFQVL